MRRLLFAFFIAMALTWSAPETQSKNPKSKNATSRPVTTSRTGCIDQQGEAYVLRELSTGGIVMKLKGKSFSDDNFARYVGHKVTVHGTVDNQGQTSVMHVTKVDDAGAGCSDK
jgi:hypothetical protein